MTIKNTTLYPNTPSQHFKVRNPRWCSYLLVLFSLLGVISCAEPKQPEPALAPPDKYELGKAIDSYFTALRDLGKFNGVVLASTKTGQVIHKAYNLYPEQERSTYVSQQSQFDVHSVSKLFAKYLIAKLETAGRVDRSTPISTYIPDFPQGDTITLHMLLNHTSGLPRSFSSLPEEAISLSPAQILASAKQEELLFAPGTTSQYSNVAYEVVYHIIETVLQKSFAQCLQDEVFGPLGMKHSGAHFYSSSGKPKSLAKNHVEGDTSLVEIPNILPEELPTARIYSTTQDLHRFLQAAQQEPYATALQDEAGVIQQSGGSDGIRAQVYTQVDSAYSYVFLANYEGIPFQQTVADLSKLFAGEAYKLPQALNRVAVALPVTTLNRYTGTYTFADLGGLALTFTVEGQHLTVYQDGERIAVLAAENETTFFEDPQEAESFEFVQAETGAFEVLMGFKGVKLKGVKQ